MRIAPFPIQIILLAFFLTWSSPAWSTEQTEASSLTPKELAWIAEHPVINVRISNSYPPFEFFENGIYQGLAYDYLTLIGERAGLTFQPTSEMAWKDALQSLQNKDGVDLVLLITHTPEREAYMSFTRDYITFPEVIFTRNNGLFISGIGDLQGRLVATENDFVEGEVLQRDIPQVRLLETETTAQALEAVALGRADAYVGNLAVGSYLIDELGLANLKIAAPTAYVDDSYAMAVRKDWPELISIIEKGLSSLGATDHQSIKQKWFVIPYEHGLNTADIVKWVLLITLIPLAFIFQLRRMVKNRTHELNASQKLLQVVQDNTSQFSGLMTPDGILCDANRTALDFVGCKKEEVVGKLFWETPWWTHNPESQEQLKQATEKAAQGETIKLEATHQGANGENRVIAFSIDPVFNEGGEVIYLVPNGHNITESKALQSKALRTSQLAALGELAAGVAHEVNNPITGIINYAQLLLNRGDKKDPNRKMLELIIKEGDRVASIVKGLLSFSRDDNTHLAPLDIRMIVDETLALNGSQLTKDGIAINVEQPEHLPLIRGNSQQLLQLFLNLLSNARYALKERDHDEHNDKKLNITLESVSSKPGEFIQITVFDNGCGIPDEKRDQVMKPFITTKPVGQGTGLGLSICNEIVNNHDGVINIASEQNCYTKVIIQLPVISKDPGATDKDT